jgi:hypothetical protein
MTGAAALQAPDETPLGEAAAARKSSKPADWRALLGGGNTDDHFRLGIKITRGAIRLRRGQQEEGGKEASAHAASRWLGHLACGSQLDLCLSTG